MNSSRVETVMLAGGLGTRLIDITEGNIPKCFVELQHNHRAIDYILEQLSKIGIEATWSTDNYYYQYQQTLKNTSQRLLWQQPGRIVETVTQPGGLVLAIATDCVFPYKDLPNMIAQHKPGTISWAVTKFNSLHMDRYRGMDVLPDMSIVGRSDKSVIRAPITLIDVDLLRTFTKKGSQKGAWENLYFDVLPRIEKVNRQRVNEGKSSILNAYYLSGPIIDFGTPSSLFFLREHFQNIYAATN